jgi:hypothetical protein
VGPQKMVAVKRSDIADEKTILLPQFSTAMPDTFRKNDWEVLSQRDLLSPKSEVELRLS